MDEIGIAIKSQLEYIYDIPFYIESNSEYGDNGFRLWPENEFSELFEVCLLYRQGIRLIIEVRPQKYAADMLADMQQADDNKIKVFLDFIKIMQQNKAKVEMKINNNICQKIDYDNWSCPWKNFHLRINVIPEHYDEIDYEKKIFVNWSVSVVGLMLSLLNVELADDNNKHFEGGAMQVLSTKYERNPINRQLCLLANGYSCKICGFDFERTYGELGRGFIHVHHVEKVSLHEFKYILDPKTDLIPICPNCHAMLHRVDPPLRPEKLQELLTNKKIEEKYINNICVK